MRDITPDRVLEVLSRHIGAEHGLHIRDLAFQCKLGLADAQDERRVRACIEQLRREGKHICATPADGYYIAQTPDELDRTCTYLYDRAMTSLSQVAAMKRVSLPDLRGQLKLPT